MWLSAGQAKKPGSLRNIYFDMILHDTVFLVIESGGKFLLIKRANKPLKGLWACPGGHVDKGEEPYQAALREMKEEVGDVEPEEKPFTIFTHDVRVGHRHRAHAFRAKRVGKVKAGSDAEEAKWFTLEEIKKLDITDYSLRALNGFFVPANFSSNDKE